MGKGVGRGLCLEQWFNKRVKDWEYEAWPVFWGLGRAASKENLEGAGIFSLWKHLKKIKHIAKSSRDASTTAHITALKAVVAFLLLYVIFTFSLFVHLWSYEFGERKLFKYFCPVGIIAFPSLHSCVLIMGYNKLRQTSLLVLSLLRCKIQGCGPLGLWHNIGKVILHTLNEDYNFIRNYSLF